MDRKSRFYKQPKMKQKDYMNMILQNQESGKIPGKLHVDSERQIKMKQRELLSMTREYQRNGTTSRAESSQLDYSTMYHPMYATNYHTGRLVDQKILHPQTKNAKAIDDFPRSILKKPTNTFYEDSPSYERPVLNNRYDYNMADLIFEDVDNSYEYVSPGEVQGNQMHYSSPRDFQMDKTHCISPRDIHFNQTQYPSPRDVYFNQRQFTGPRDVQVGHTRMNNYMYNHGPRPTPGNDIPQSQDAFAYSSNRTPRQTKNVEFQTQYHHSPTQRLNGDIFPGKLHIINTRHQLHKEGVVDLGTLITSKMSGLKIRKRDRTSGSHLHAHSYARQVQLRDVKHIGSPKVAHVQNGDALFVSDNGSMDSSTSSEDFLY